MFRRAYSWNNVPGGGPCRYVIQFGFHRRFDFAWYFGVLHGRFAEITEAIHERGRGNRIDPPMPSRLLRIVVWNLAIDIFPG
jgi:hypothetical protein